MRLRGILALPAGCHVNSLRDRIYNKKALLFDMEVGYQSELNWNCAVVQQYVPSIAKLKTSLIIPCQQGSFFPLLLMSNVLSSLLTTNFQQVGFKKASSQTHLVSLMSHPIVPKLVRGIHNNACKMITRK